MCRIAGIIDPERKEDELLSDISEMCNILQHGGPDGQGTYISAKTHLAFGHRRLALLDLSEAGRQPMSYDKDRFQITYNGEIYNYPSLKKELEGKGYQFHTLCDTEMILVAFKEWGIEAFSKFKGMFAIALLDNVTQQVYLVRDASGIKPLYYFHSSKKLYFASEVRAFSIFRELNEKEVKAKILLLAYGHIPEPLTALKNVLMLGKGQFLQFDIASGKTKFSTFKSYAFSESIKERQQALNDINEKLEKSVSRHLLSDAPIGVFLSGGIDSSLLALLAHKRTGERLKTLSLYFNEAQFSEKKYQDIIIDQAKCDHAQFLLTGEEFSSHFERILNEMDSPTTDGINTWFISKYAKDYGLKAVLSGVGSDELFGGYPSFRRISVVKYFKKLPTFILKALSHSGKKIKRLIFLSIPGATGEYLFLRGIYIPSEIAEILSIPENKVWEVLRSVPIVPPIDKLNEKNQASWMELNLYMQNQLLRDSDVMSMAHGIEIRVPFLDPSLIDKALSISSKIKYSGLYPKQILIDSFDKLLPEAIWKRKKMGFTFPFKDWLKGNKFVEHTMTNNRSYQEVFNKFQSGKLSWAHVMAILVLEHKLNG